MAMSGSSLSYEVNNNRNEFDLCPRNQHKRQARGRVRSERPYHYTPASPQLASGCRLVWKVLLPELQPIFFYGPQIRQGFVNRFSLSVMVCTSC